MLEVLLFSLSSSILVFTRFTEVSIIYQAASGNYYIALLIPKPDRSRVKGLTCPKFPNNSCNSALRVRTTARARAECILMQRWLRMQAYTRACKSSPPSPDCTVTLRGRGASNWPVMEARPYLQRGCVTVERVAIIRFGAKGFAADHRLASPTTVLHNPFRA